MIPRRLWALWLAAAGALASAGRKAPPAALDARAPLPPSRGTYRVLLPPERAPAERYPVLYFLHDYFGDSGILWRTGAAGEILRRMAAGEMPPLILVAPDGDHGYWSDFFDGSARYETWVAEGLRQEVERLYPALPERRARAVAGISMGGFGAVKLALRRAELYSAAASLSGALLPLDWHFVEDASPFLRRDLRRIFGRSAAANNLAANDLRQLVHGPFPQGPPRLTLRCGTEDKYRLDEVAETFAAEARKAGLPVVVELEPGGHNWRYWRTSVVEVVAEQARAFAREGRL